MNNLVSSIQKISSSELQELDGKQNYNREINL